MPRSSLTRHFSIAAVMAILAGCISFTTGNAAGMSSGALTSIDAENFSFGAERISPADEPIEESPGSSVSVCEGVSVDVATPNRGLPMIARIDACIGLALQRTRTVIVSLSMPTVDPTLQSDFTRIQV